MRWRAVFLLLCCVGLLPGCWDRLEINDLAIVDLAGIDPDPEGLRLTVSVLVPTRAQTSPSASGSGPEGGSSAVCYSAEGKSIMDAMTKIQARLSRRLFWAHTRMLVISEEYARDGVRPALDFWSRHREPRLQMQVAVTSGKASELVSASPRLEKLMSESIREILNLRTQVRVTMKDFLGALRSETEQPIAPMVRLLRVPAGADPQAYGTVVFRDDRAVGSLNEIETRGLQWLRGELSTGMITLDIPSGGHVSMTVIRGNSAIHPDFSTGQLRMKAHFTVEDDVYETSALIDLGKEETIEFVEALLRQEITLRVRRTLAKVQKEFGVDVIMFGDVVSRSAPRRWEGGLKQRWDDIFRNLPVDITVDAHVRRTGEHSAPLGAEKSLITEPGAAKQKE